MTWLIQGQVGLKDQLMDPQLELKTSLTVEVVMSARLRVTVLLQLYLQTNGMTLMVHPVKYSLTTLKVWWYDMHHVTMSLAVNTRGQMNALYRLRRPSQNLFEQ